MTGDATVQTTGELGNSTPYDSGPFFTGVEGRSSSNSVLYHNGSLWLIGGGVGGGLYSTDYPLLASNGDGIDIEDGAVTNTKGQWSSDAIMFKPTVGPPPPKDWAPWCFSGCGLVACGDTMFLFWNQQSEPNLDEVTHNGSLLGAWNDCQGGGWNQPVTLLASDENPIVTSGEVVFSDDVDRFVGYTCADVSATSFGSEAIIVAAALALPGPGEPDWGSHERGIYIGIYRPADLNATKGTWSAVWHTYLTWDFVIGRSPGFTDFGYHLSIDWFASVPSSAQALEYTLLLYGDAKTQGQGSTETLTYFYGTLVLDQRGTVVGVTAVGPMGGLGSTTQPYSVARDPAGRLVVTGTAPGDNIRFLSFETKLGGYFPVFDVTCMPAPAADPQIPSVGYFIDPAKLPVPAPPAPGSDASELHAVYQFVFWSEDVRCEVRRYGTIEILVNPALVPTPTTNAAQAQVVQGIIDGPIPIPNENIATFRYPKGETKLGEITYGNTVSGSTSTSVQSEVTVGVQFEEHFTAGLGPAYKIGWDAGTGTASGFVQGTSLSTNKPFTALVETDPVTKENRIAQTGIVFSQTPTIRLTAYRFRGADGKVWTDPTTQDSGVAPGSVMVNADLSDGLSGYPALYTPFAVSPGDLISYTPQAWNARMQSLATRYGQGQLYSGNNYFGKVIVGNAYSFGGTKYLRVSWTPGSAPPVAFSSWTESFVERSWTMSSEFYAGLSGGGGFEIGGVDTLHMEFEMLAGTTTVDSGNTEATTSQDWGITLEAGDEGWGPPPPISSDGFERYTFRIYFLPAALSVPQTPSAVSNIWVLELQNYLNKGGGETLEVELSPSLTKTVTYPPIQQPVVLDSAGIDPGAGCWRIVYVLESFKQNDGTEWVYDGSLD